MHLTELQVDGLVGPTHNYAGLSSGNVASTSHGGAVSHPRAAALQGLEKMAFVASLGIEQAVMPPQPRPDLDMLRCLGIEGTDEQVLQRAHATDPTLLAQVSSASAMWTANAATVTPSPDAEDHRVHMTPANLRCKFHRAIEPPQTQRTLNAIFPDPSRFAIHDPLPAADQFGDEGAANHTRLATPSGTVHFFVYGRTARDAGGPAPKRFPARQTLEASQAVARRHGVTSTLFAQQHPDVIDAGVFHNDVISVGTAGTLLIHERALVNQSAVLDALHEKLGDGFAALIVSNDALSVDEAIRTYLFNSQLLETPRGLELVAPKAVDASDAAQQVVDAWVAGPSPIVAAHTIDVRESMQNGGGPACLRLRVPLTQDELASVHPGVRWSASLHATLTRWVERWYPESLEPAALADPLLAVTCRDALASLTGELDLGAIYPFQR